MSCLPQCYLPEKQASNEILFFFVCVKQMGFYFISWYFQVLVAIRYCYPIFFFFTKIKHAIPIQIPSPQIMPIQIPSPQVMPIQIPSPQVMPIHISNPQIIPIQIPSPQVMPIQIPSPGIMPIQIPSPQVMPIQISSPQVIRIQISVIYKNMPHCYL